MKIYYIIFLLIFLSALGLRAESLYNQVEVKYTGREVKIDGEFDDIWKKVVPYNMGDCNGTINYLIVENYLTTVRLLWDRKYFYILFICDDTDAVSTFTLKDQPLYEEEICEVFMRIPDSGNMFELSASPSGVSYDAKSYRDALNKMNFDIGWNIKDLNIAAKIVPLEEGRCVWRVEMAIPWKSIGVNPGKNNVLYGNFLRYEKISNDKLRSKNNSEVFLPLSIFPTYVSGWPSGSSSHGKIVLCPPDK